MDLVVECYQMPHCFPKSETYGLCSQLQRAAVSIPSNIAEGHARQHIKEYVHHLFIASGSLAELETQIELARRLTYLNDEDCTTLLARCEEISRMLAGLRGALLRKLAVNE
jgi:four helix bundle protein